MTPTAVAVQTASTVVLAANPNRRYAVFMNDSNKSIYLSLGATAVLHAGIELSATNGHYEINDSNLFLGAIYAIAEGGDKVLTVTEGV